MRRRETLPAFAATCMSYALYLYHKPNNPLKNHTKSGEIDTVEPCSAAAISRTSLGSIIGVIVSTYLIAIMHNIAAALTPCLCRIAHTREKTVGEETKKHKNVFFLSFFLSFFFPSVFSLFFF
jgi:hypothetical protein